MLEGEDEVPESMTDALEHDRRVLSEGVDLGGGSEECEKGARSPHPTRKMTDKLWTVAEELASRIRAAPEVVRFARAFDHSKETSPPGFRR